MKSKKLIALVLGVALATSTFMGCGGSKKTTSSNVNGKEVKMDKDQYLNLLMGAEPKTLDVSRSSDTYSGAVFSEVYEALTRVEQDENGNDVIKAAGAEKWEHNEDGSVWTFHIRDHKWSDGKQVTAGQYEYAIKRTLNPKTGASYAFFLSPIKGAEEYNSGKGTADDVGVKALDDKTLQFTLKQPCPYFLNLTYFELFFPQRQDLVEKHGEKYGSDLQTLEAFCGPFVIKKWNHQHEIILEKNPQYWDKDSVKLEKVNFKIIKDVNSAYNSLYSSELDCMEVKKPEWIKKFDSTKKFDNVKGFAPSVGYMFFNSKDKLFKNANVRKAFSAAITRDDYAGVISNGVDEPAYAWCPPAVQLNGKDFREVCKNEPIKKLLKDNPDPKKLLAEGLKELGMDPNPEKLTISILYGHTDPETRRRAEYEQQMFQNALGVTVKAEYVEWPVFQKRTGELNYQLAGMGWSGDYNDPSTFFDMWMTGADAVPTGWSSKRFDEIAKKAASSIDAKERLDLYKEAENILLYDEAIIAPTTFRRKNTYKAKYVKNLMTPLFGAKYEFKNVYIDGREK